MTNPSDDYLVTIDGHEYHYTSSADVANSEELADALAQAINAPYLKPPDLEPVNRRGGLLWWLGRLFIALLLIGQLVYLLWLIRTTP